VVADRQQLVQRVDDRRVGERVPDLAQGLVAEQVGVLHVHDVGAQLGQQLRRTPV
jgi:hypothetical protein